MSNSQAEMNASAAHAIATSAGAANDSTPKASGTSSDINHVNYNGSQTATTKSEAIYEAQYVEFKKDFEDKILALKTKTEKLMAKTSEQEKIINDRDAEIKKLEEKLLAGNKSDKEKESGLESLIEAMNKLQKESQESNERNQQLEQEKDEISKRKNQELESLRQEKDAMEKKLGADNKGLEERITSITENRNAELAKKAEAMDKAQKENDALLEAAKTEKLRLIQTQEALQQKHDDLVAANHRIAGENKSIKETTKKEKEALQKKIAEQESKILELNRAKEAQKTKSQKAESDHNSALTALKAENAKITEERNTLKTSLTALKGTHETAVTQHAQASDAAEKDRLKLVKEKEELLQRLGSVEERLQKSVKANDRLQKLQEETGATAAERIKKLEADLQSADNIITGLKADKMNSLMKLADFERDKKEAVAKRVQAIAREMEANNKLRAMEKELFQHRKAQNPQPQIVKQNDGKAKEADKSKNPNFTPGYSAAQSKPKAASSAATSAASASQPTANGNHHDSQSSNSSANNSL